MSTNRMFNRLYLGMKYVFALLIFSVFISGVANAETCTCDVGEHMVNGQCKPCDVYYHYYCPGECREVQCPIPDFNLYEDLFNGKMIQTDYKVLISKASSEMDCYAEGLVDTDVGTLYIQFRSDETNGLYKRQAGKTYISVKPGYYLQWLEVGNIVWGYKHYSGASPCTNEKPANSHYVSAPNLTTNDCPWECDDGFGHTSDDRCLPLCRIGATAMNGINIYAEKHTKYAMAVPRGGATCWIHATRDNGGKLIPIN
ncbi:MAG: hypothetical protein IJ560_02340 [Alphaproteobacteria bacterium]|nr:hypothetical protein [Alphaproteobacteria bacterium]